MKRLVVLALLILLSACGPLGQPSAEEIVRRAESAMESLERAHAIVEVQASVDNQTMRVLGEGWMEGEKRRAQVLEASAGELVGLLAVSDGATGWLYHPEMNRALTGTLDELEAYREAQGEAPSGFDFNSLTGMVDELLRVTNQELLGSETIAGREAWHLRLTASQEAPPALVAAGGVVDLWISKEDDIPLQLVYSGNAMGEGRITVQSFNTDGAMDPSLFTFSPPAGVEPVDVSTLLPERMTLLQAREQASFPLLSTASDSSSAALVDVYRVSNAYIQHFEGSLGEWQLVQHSAGDESPPHEWKSSPSAEPVSLRGVTGWITTDSERGATILAWEERGVQVVLSGTLSRDGALRLAETLE